ncbi:hypothetical protein Vi05172_g12990 [Venturia inaequalis]|nr:hypothetical protein Vi05172_g12990 [Venturia inaequalis]
MVRVKPGPAPSGAGPGRVFGRVLEGTPRPKPPR